MTIRMWAGVLALLVGTMALGADSKPASPFPTPTTSNAQFERLKKQVGTWLVVDEKGKVTDQVASVVRLSGAGSVLIETLFPGQPHEMISVYHLDGSDLVMTHYCALGNQPHLKADPASPTGEIRFKFVGGTNLNVAKDKHMHDATVKFVDDDTVEISGSAWEGGKACEGVGCNMKLARKK